MGIWNRVTGAATSYMNPHIRPAHVARQKQAGTLWDYYDGNHKPSLKTRAGGYDDNVILNWTEAIVDRGISALFGHMPQFETENKAVTALWSVNPDTGFDPLVFLQSLAMNGGVTGTAFSRLYRNGDGDKIIAVPSEQMDIYRNPDDYADIGAFTQTWSRGKSYRRHVIQRIGFSFDMAGGDVSADWEMGKTWEIIEQNWINKTWVEFHRSDWPYTFPPIFFCQNMVNPRGNFGKTDLGSASVVDKTNMLASNANKIIRHHAHPRTIITGSSISAQEISNSPQDVLVMPESDAKAFNLEMQSDMSAARAQRLDLRNGMMQISGVPMLDPNDTNFGAMSGFALTILYMPLIAKTNIKRRLYGGMIAQINSAVIQMNGGTHEDIAIKWPDVLPASQKEKAEIFKTLSAEGDIKGAAMIAGYTEQEAESLAETPRISLADQL